MAGFLFLKGIHTDIHFAVIALRATDVPAAANFYRDVIGLKMIPHQAGNRLHFDLGGCILTIIPDHPALPPDPEPRFPIVAFSTLELDKAIDKLCDHGVDLPWGVETDTIFS